MLTLLIINLLCNVPMIVIHPAKTQTIHKRIIHPDIFHNESGTTDKKVNTVKPKAIKKEIVILEASKKDI